MDCASRRNATASDAKGEPPASSYEPGVVNTVWTPPRWNRSAAASARWPSAADAVCASATPRAATRWSTTASEPRAARAASAAVIAGAAACGSSRSSQQ